MKHFWENIFRSDKNANQVTDLLKECPIFSTLSRRELKFVESVIHTRTYRAGEYVFRQGEVGIGMYIMMSGQVDIQLEEVQNFNQDSEKKVTFVTRLEPGDFFGEIGLIEANGRRTANAITASDAVLIGFFQPDLEEIVERNPQTGAKILKQIAEVLGRRLRATSDKVMQLKDEMNSAKAEL